MSKSPMTVFLEGSWWKYKVSTCSSSLPVTDHVSSTLLSHLVLHGLVDPVDQPGEGLPIDRFGQGISGVDGVIDREWTEDLYSERSSSSSLNHNYR